MNANNNASNNRNMNGGAIIFNVTQIYEKVEIVKDVINPDADGIHYKWCAQYGTY